MMPRAFLQDKLAVGEQCIISGEAGHHFARVLRSRPGEQLVVAAANGPYLAVITDVDSKAGHICVQTIESYSSHEPACQVVVIQGIAKGDKMDTIVQKCTEVGVGHVIAYQAARSVVQLGQKAGQKVERWRKIATEAAGQAQRDVVPSVQYANSLAALQMALSELSITHLLLLDEAETAVGLKSTLNPLPAQTEGLLTIAIAIGPEGGWDDGERAQLTATFGAIPVTLGPRILRTETAGVVATGAILYEYGELGG